MDSILPIWKPLGITSFDVIRSIKKNISKIKIGHCGTLDPFAQGVLIICTGSKTKEIPELILLKKKYECKIVFGVETDTLDSTGKVIKSNNKLITKNNIIKQLKELTGIVEQVPPYFSALKVNGVRLYKLARKDIFIRLKPRNVKINELKLIDIEKKSINLYVDCDKGTYIRSLARDIAYKLNTFAYVKNLSRINVGHYDKACCMTIKEAIKCLK